MGRVDIILDDKRNVDKGSNGNRRLRDRLFRYPIIWKGDVA